MRWYASIAAKSVLLGSAFLLAALPAVTADLTIAAPMAMPEAHATIHCPGITSVPMTADAVQALPLHLLRTLSCDEPVAVLSNTEGDTVYVRAADGKDGYVARMYLNLGGSPAKGAHHRDVSASPVNNVLRWQAGAPGCDQFMSKVIPLSRPPPMALPSRYSLKIRAGSSAPPLPFPMGVWMRSNYFQGSSPSTSCSPTPGPRETLSRLQSSGVFHHGECAAFPPCRCLAPRGTVNRRGYVPLTNTRLFQPWTPPVPNRQPSDNCSLCL
jgi:hypothetical protein